MKRQFDCRLLIDPPETGTWNMGVDEALLVDAIENGTASLRFYQWSEPTLSLGYFQRYDERLEHESSRECPLVRRQSGGGAILHDRELTYSLILPARHPLASHVKRLYSTVHRSFAQALVAKLPKSELSWTVQLREQDALASDGNEPFLCFQRQACGDVVLTPSHIWRKAEVSSAPMNSGGWKILGSAQRRRHGAVLQHGSLILQRSPSAPEIAGWSDLTHTALCVDELSECLSVQLGDTLSMRLHKESLSRKLQSKSEKLANMKYGTSAWTNRR